ncbi:MAG TPA: MaoC family dehydratase [Candidatus Sulfotelmatobacter sp.]|nr:MaoC family dehydratase [Candidatus Sulfotelmatobacter sp.]
MAVRVFKDFAELRAAVGQELGVSDWMTMTQERINTFADASGDHQWIHVDVERCKKEMPGGKTIAHGYLTLSLCSQFVGQVRKIEGIRRGINYGSNRVRFISPVQVGARIRGRVKLKAVDDVPPNAVRCTYETTVEIEGGGKPACVAETIGVHEQ